MAMRWLIVVLAVAALVPGPARAEEDAKGKPGVMSWFKNWKNALERSAVEGKYRKMRTATAVAAVRGSGQAAADSDEAYWKGGWSEKREKERVKERGELAAAVGLIFEEKPAEARAALDAFEKAHPKSSFMAEVKDARAKLDEIEGKGQAAAEAKPEAKTEAKAAEAPAAEAPKAEEPKAEEPKAEEPKAEEPKAEAKPAEAAEPAKAE